MTYDPALVALSVVIAVVAATAALWAALNIKSPIAVTVASLVMGAAVSSMHYTGMFAVRVDVAPSGEALPGATAMQFIFPLAVGLGSYLFLTSAFVALSPTAGEREASASAQRPVESAAAPTAGPAPRDGPDGTTPTTPSEEAMRTPRRTPTAGAETPPQPPVRGRRAHAGPPADERSDTEQPAPRRTGRPRARDAGACARAPSAPRSSAC